MPSNQEQLPLTESVYYILLALHTPMHGYGIMQFVKEISKERVTLGPGTLYGAIKTLQEKKWITLIDESSRKKEYVITDIGRQVVKSELQRLQELIQNGTNIINGGCQDENKEV
ncbi:PadR family transcriptional regulator [Salirhabdus sp. Marseille-P4669]|uniref:PadR family transcriptional regulator n=1 Tax=Salirhabdus sp. Marseille-P4669 TaxID=2042310 RepID=UPI000C7DEFA3|nr:PadR family transcriptional regulator [Salirhabdus sp. Marseille-P4669]